MPSHLLVRSFLVSAFLGAVSLAEAQEPSKAPTPPTGETKAAPPPAVPVRPVVAPRPGASTEEVRASHILVATEEEAKKVRSEIEAAGSDKKAFTAAARKYSKDISTKVLGGDLHYFTTQSGFDKAFSDEAFRLKPGDLSQPVKSSFGWHLILVTDRRDKASAKAKDTTPVDATKKDMPHGESTKAPLQPTPQPTPPVGAADTTKTAGPDQLAPTPTRQTPVTGVEKAAPVGPPAPLPQVDAKRRPQREQGLRITLETTKSGEYQMDQFIFPREQAVELNVTIKNEGSREQPFFARELLPLGLRVSNLGEREPIPGDFSALKEPANLVQVLKPYEIYGIELSLNDYWKTLPPRRYGVNWDSELFLKNLETKFPKARELPDYANLTAFLKKREMVRTDVVVRDVSPRMTFQRGRDLSFSVMESLDPNKNFYVRLKVSGSETPIAIRLYTKEQLKAVRHFANLVQNGFYDNLDFFEVEKGDFILGGCPTRTGTGAPSSILPLLRNDAKLDHKRGVVSLVSRSVRSKGPAMGGQVGSIFVVCLKPHPEWNEEHVPVGEVTSGLEVLENLGPSAVFREITVVTEDQLGTIAAATPANPAAANAAVGNPEAVIKTSKGDLTIELFEDVARNTVANFITLTEGKFYDKDGAGTGKQKFFITKNQSGQPVLAQTGSPNNDFESGPGYHIADEPNAKKHVKGALVMVMQYDEATKGYVPNTAGSQFFICLADIPSYDYQEKKPTIFGQVKSGTEVLEKLAEGDTVESVTIAKKKPQPYQVIKIPTP